jgi:hypothetical protein
MISSTQPGRQEQANIYSIQSIFHPAQMVNIARQQKPSLGGCGPEKVLES